MYYSRDKSVESTIGDVASYVRKLKQDHLSQLSLDDASDMLVVARAEQRPGDDEYTSQLVRVLQQVYTDDSETNAAMSVRQLSSAFLSILELGKTDLEIVKIWTERLLRLQHPDGVGRWSLSKRAQWWQRRWRSRC